jgi:hypothetical protein
MIQTRSTFSLRNPAAFTLAAIGVWVILAPGDADAAKYRFEPKGNTSLTGPSGYGSSTSKKTTPDGSSAVSSVSIGERGDVPAYFKGASQELRFADNAATDWKTVTLPAGAAITGIEVCTNGPANATDKHRVKGVRLWGKMYNRDTGKLEGSAEDHFERTNCPANGWRGAKYCPSGQAAIGFEVYAGDNGAITGIGLICSAFNSTLYLELGEKCTLDGTACDPWSSYCRFLPMQNCGKVQSSPPAKAGAGPIKVEGVCTSRDFSQCWAGLSEAERTERVCGCDGKVRDNICSLRSSGVSRAPDMQFCAPKR